MRSLVLTISAILSIPVMLFSQQVLFEDFTGSSIPAGWSVVNNTTSPVVWEHSSNPSSTGGFPGTFGYVGATGGHMRVDSDLSGSVGIQENTDLRSLSINCSSLTVVNLRFWEYFKKYLADVATVEVSTNGTNWTVVHTTSAGLATNSETANPNEVNIDISLIAAGQSTVWIKWNYQGQWDYYWFIDDVEVYQPLNWDLECTSITSLTTVGLNDAPFPITGLFTNKGGQTVTSLTINYTVNGGPIVSAAVSGLSLAPLSTNTLSHPTLWNPSSAGTYAIDVWASNLNGNIDQNPANDHSFVTINVVTALASRMVLHEEFSSSSSGPDVAANIALKNLLDANPGLHTLIKYQMSWPTVDPYYTLEGLDRKIFYTVTAVPELYVDGVTKIHPGNYTAGDLTTAQAIPSVLTIAAVHEICPDSQKVSVTIDLTSTSSIANGMTLQVGIVEKTTQNNTSGNGETIFYNVMKKMLPDANGTSLPAFVPGVTQRLQFDYYFQGNYRLPNGSTSQINHAIEHSVEDFSDLVTVIWVQNNTTMEVFNSAYSIGDSICVDLVMADAGIDAEVCPGNSVIIGGSPTASGGQASYTYSWIPATGLSDPTIANPTAAPTATTTYTVLVTDNNGATANDMVTITVYDAGITVQSFNCDTVVTLVAVPGLVAYQWNTGETTQAITVTQSGNYSYIGFHPSGCLLNSPIQAITVGGTPQPTVTQNGNVLSTQVFSTYQWSLNGFLINGATQQTYTIFISGLYSVEVTDVNGCVGNFGPIYAQLAAVCAAPTGTFTDNITTSTARLNWTAVTVAMSYVIRGKASASNNWVYLLINNGTTNFKNVVGLANNITYEWQIQTQCNTSGSDTSDWSQLETFTTGCQTSDTTWTDPVTASGAQLHWNTVAGTQGYEIRGRRIGGGWATVLVGGGNTSLKNVFGLLPATTYEWTIRSLCNATGTINSEFIGLIQFTTSAGARQSGISELSGRPSIKAIPNPFGNYTSIHFEQRSVRNFSLFDLNGKLLRSWFSDESDILIHMQELVPGMYYLQIEEGGEKRNLKLLVN